MLQVGRQLAYTATDTTFNFFNTTPIYEVLIWGSQVVSPVVKPDPTFTASRNRDAKLTQVCHTHGRHMYTFIFVGVINFKLA